MGGHLIASTDKTQFLCNIKNQVAQPGVLQSFGSCLPGTEAGEYAAQFYADMVVEGEKKGGMRGFFMQVGGWTGGLFASLWTPETAGYTTFTLATTGLGALASAGKLGAASVPVMRTLQTAGSFQGGLSAGQAMTGRDLDGKELSAGARVVHGLAAAVTFLTLPGLKNGALFGRAYRPQATGPQYRPPGAGAGFFNKGPVRLGWSWRGPKLPGGNANYFALHGGGTFQGVNQGPHWHIYLNRFWPSSPAPAPAWATTIIRSGQIIGVLGSGAYGYEIGNEYFNCSE